MESSKARGIKKLSHWIRRFYMLSCITGNVSSTIEGKNVKVEECANISIRNLCNFTVSSSIREFSLGLLRKLQKGSLHYLGKDVTPMIFIKVNASFQRQN